MWEEFKKTEGSDLKVWEVGKIIGQKWRELGEEDKQVYIIVIVLLKLSKNHFDNIINR